MQKTMIYSIRAGDGLACTMMEDLQAAISGDMFTKAETRTGSGLRTATNDGSMLIGT